MSSELDPGRQRLYCPHFENIDEQTLRQLFSKVAAVRSQNRDLFEFTHRPIEVFRSAQGTEESEQVVSEKEVYREFSDERVGNFTVVIEGEVGTGKSELCAYLAHRLRAEADRPILHVDKDDDLMTLLSERIPEFYEEHFDESLPDASDFQRLREHLQENGSVVANNATSGAILNLSDRGYDVDVADDENEIREYIEDRLSLLVEEGEYAKEIKFVTEKAYNREDFLQVIEDDIPAEEAVEAFNSELWREIRDRYETASLDDVLERVGEKFTDTRPVIIFEDFAITAMEAERLRNYMERDKMSDNWDFIVAGTRDSTEVLHTQTAEDRFEFYRTNRQNSNSVLFLDEDSSVDFIRPYLGYFKTFDGSVTYDRSSQGLELDLEPAPAGTICSDCGFCDESFRDVFPFNESFLERIYAGLRRDEQSPREFVMAVFDVLRDYYEGYIDAPSDADRLSSLTNPVDPATEIYEQAEPVARLARWYGSPTDDGIEVDRRFVEVFGFSEIVGDLSAVEHRGDVVVIPTGTQSGGTTDSGTSVDTTPHPEPDVGSQEPSKTERLINEHGPNVQPWQRNPGDFPEISRYLRIALREAIKDLTDDFELYDRTGLRYNLSSQKDPFVFRTIARAPVDDQIVIDPEEFRLSNLKKLLEFGIRLDEDRSTADAEALFRELGTQLTGHARDWQQKVKTENLESDGCFFKQTAEYEFEDFALAGCAYIVLLDSPYMTMNAETLHRRFADDESYSIDPSLRKKLDSELPADDYEAIVDFVEDGQWFEEMVGAFFGVSGDTLDLGSFRQRLDWNSPSEVLSGLGRQYIKNISSRVRFDTDNKVRNIANGAYDFNSALEGLQNEYDPDVVSVFAEELAAISVEDIGSVVETLGGYNTADPDMIESLNNFVRLDQTDIDEAVEAAEVASELRTGSAEERIQAALISMKLGASDVYEKYDSITIVGGSETSDFAERFQTVGEHYVE